MPDTVTKRLIGRDVSFSLYNGTEADATGIITYGSAATMAGIIESCEVDLAAELEDIHGADATGSDWVKLGVDWTLTLTGIKPRNSAGAIQTGAMAFDVIKVVITTPSTVWTFVGEVQNFNWATARGKQNEKLVLKRKDLGATANPALA
jgi:hypothetical protein